MDYQIRKVSQHDLAAVAKIELACFPVAEAAVIETLADRIQWFGDNFYVAEASARIIGFINGSVTNRQKIIDEMFENSKLHQPDGAYQSIFGLDVHPDYQHRGVATGLMRHMIETAKMQRRKGLILTCKKSLLSFYEGFGYCNLGQSDSVHGGAQWYDMILEL